MESAFMDFVQKQAKPSVADTKVEVIRVFDEESVFVTKHLDLLKENGVGNFSRKKEYGTITQFKCERFRKPSGQSTGDPTKSRANACEAYVSYKFVYSADRCMKACIIRTKGHHTGHDLGNEEEKFVSRIHPDLVAYIELLAMQDKKCNYILSEIQKWSQSRGYFDMHDREYYPLPSDVKYIISTVRNQPHRDADDAVSVDSIIKSDFQGKILYYQPYHKQEQQPLIIIMQTPLQRDMMKKFGKTLIFVDATYSGVTAYGFALYTMVVRDGHGHGFPAAFIILSEDSEVCLTKAFHIIREKNSICPRAFMIDKDLKEANAINEAFPDSSILLCWFHVLQAVHRWLLKQTSGLSGVGNKEKRSQVIRFMTELKNCNTESEFMALACTVTTRFDKPVVTYLEDNWLHMQVAVMWSNFGRRFFHENSETNNLVERFFGNMKHHFLNGYANHRVDDLLLLLDSKVLGYYRYTTGLQEAGRLRNPRNDNHSKKLAEELLTQSWSEKVKWDSSFKCQIPSASNDSMSYEVNIVECTCTCPVSSSAGMCKHLHLALQLAEAQGKPASSQRKEKALELFNNGEYYLQGNSIITCSEQNASKFNLSSKACTCIAASHGIACVCQLLADLVTNEKQEQVTDNEFQNVVESKIAADPPKLSTLQMIEDIYTWSKTWEFVDTCQLHQQVAKVHLMAFSKFAKKSGGRRIHVLHEYRKKIEKAKKMIRDHDYAQPKRLKRLVRTKSCPSQSFPKKRGSMQMKKRGKRARNMETIYSSKNKCE
ncbi:uncharacterized protein [Ptychodera flava]|uniref:uncharacterized protein n=1 Tax=Ptychodera flava TaxID=63121 RepID=UPI00396A72F2